MRHIARFRLGASLVPLLAAAVVLVGALALLAMSGGGGSGETAEEILAKVATESQGPLTAVSQEEPAETQAIDPRRTKVASPDPVDVAPGGPGDRIDGAAPLEFEIPFLELGTLVPGSVHENVIGFRNTSNAPVTLKRITTGCNCTRAYIQGDDSVFEPGVTHYLVIETDAQFKLITKAVSVNVAVEEYTGAYRYTTRFDVNNVVSASPSFVNARDRDKGRITLHSIDNEPFRVLSVNGEPPVFPESEEYDPEADGPRGMFTIEWDFSDVSMPPRLLVIETDHPDSRVFGLAVYHRGLENLEKPHFRGGIGGTQTEENMGYVRPGGTHEFTVEYFNIPDVDGLTASFTEHDDVTVEILEKRPGKLPTRTLVTYLVTMADDLEPGRFLRPMNLMSGTSVRRIWLYGVVPDGPVEN